MKTGHRLLRFVPVILVMGTIFLLSHQTGSDIQLPRVPGIDKLLHALAYGVLAGTAVYAFPPGTRRRRTLGVGLAVMVFCLLHGLADEFHQSFIPGRTAGWADLAADAAGSMLAVYGWFRFSAPGTMVPVKEPGIRS
ncbi:MAG: VanZ family protein [Desulfobulbaceae bacterium]|jgi:VanZ family protein|nr:VanZ family protein [Desulfobulbaceae bacterium]MDY0351454.1 VanZ family protein [Desulfobulbaceae bacterium]